MAIIGAEVNDLASMMLAQSTASPALYDDQIDIRLTKPNGQVVPQNAVLSATLGAHTV